MKNQLQNWLQETLNRLFIKQPKYFKYWTWLSYLLMAICGIPYILQQAHNIWPSFQLPDAIIILSNKFVTGASAAMLLMSKLVVKTPQVGQTTEGQAVQVTSPTQMPFTSKSEAAEIEKKKPPLETIPEVPAAPGDNKPNV